MSQEGNTANSAANQDGAQAGQNGQPASTATSDGTGNNTAAGTNAGAGTGTAQGSQGQEKTFTQKEVDEMFQKRLSKAVKAELKKMAGESEGTPTVEELQRQLSEERQKTRGYSARDSITDYLGDPANKLHVKAENIRAIEKLVLAELAFDDDGSPTNLKEAVESVRKLAPSLFNNSPAPINAGAGTSNGAGGGFDMNAQIRQAAGRR